jgi:hypothetical protein
LHYLVEVNVLSAASFAEATATEGSFRLAIETTNGQCQQCDFLLQQDSPNQPLTARIDQTVKIFVPVDIMERKEFLENFAVVTLEVDQPSASKVNSTTNAPEKSPKEKDKHEMKKTKKLPLLFDVSNSFNSMNGAGMNPSKNNFSVERMNSPMIKLGETSLFANRDPNSELEFHLKFDKHPIRLEVALKQFIFLNSVLSNTIPAIYCVCSLTDHDGVALTENCLAMTSGSDPAPQKKKPTHIGTRNEYVFRSSVTDNKVNYSWDNESFRIDSKSVLFLDSASYLLLELRMKPTSNRGEEGAVIGQSLVPINAFKFSNPTELDCLVHAMTEIAVETKKLAVLHDSNPSCVYGLGHLQISLHISLWNEFTTTLVSGASLLASPPDRIAGRIPVSSLVKVSMNVKPIRPTDCAWPAYILSHSVKTIDPAIFYLGFAPDGIHIQTDSTSTTTNGLSILRDCEERVNSASEGLHLLVKYNTFCLGQAFILNESTLLLGVGFRRIMSSIPKLVYRDVHFDFLVGPCLAEDIYVTITNNVNMHPLRDRLGQHIRSSEKDSEESLYALTKLFQDVINKSITHISAAEYDLNDPGFNESNESAEIAVNRLKSDVNESNQEHQPLRKKKILFCEQEMKIRLNKVSTWNRLLPKRLSTHSSMMSLSNSSNVFKMRFLYLKKATLMMYLWYLIGQSPVDICADKHCIKASRMLFDEIGQHVNPRLMYIEDLDALLPRICGILTNLENEVRCFIFDTCRIIMDTRNDVSLTLSKMIYEKYIIVSSMLLGTLEYFELNSNVQASVPKSYIISNPQKIRDLIKFVIINDNVFEEYCNAILKPHHYEFNKRPLLSNCIKFDKLLEQFSASLDRNLLMWDNRLVEYFMNTRGEQNGTVSSETFFLPWDIVTLNEKETDKELFISNIPETIQLQLNVEVGLKKIVPEYFQEKGRNHVLDQNEESLYWIDLLNDKLAQSIARSYVTRALQYQKVLLSDLIQNPDDFLKAFHADHIATGSSILIDNGSNREKKYANDMDEKEEIMFFLVSLINDCHRLIHTHIPYSIQLFSNAYHESNRWEGTKGSCLSIADNNFPCTNPKNFATFRISLNAMTAVSHRAVNELTNQIFFHCELKPYIIAGWDEFFGAVNPTRASNNDTSAVLSVRSMRQRFISFLITGSQKSVSQNGDQEEDDQRYHSNVEIILATLSEFFGFIQHHVSQSDLEKIFYLCMEKLLLRYVLFIRDFHLYAERMKKKIKSTSSKKDSPVPNRKTPDDTSAEKPIMSRRWQYNLHDHEGEIQSKPTTKHSSKPFERSNRKSSFFASAYNPFTLEEDYEKNVFKEWNQDAREMMKFYPDMKGKLFSNKCTDDLGNEKENAALADMDDSRNPYRRSLVDLFNFLMRVIALSTTEDYPGQQMINEFFLNEFELTVSV